MSRVSLIVVAILSLLVGSLVWWFFTTHERYEKVIQLGYAGEAATNKFYAAELFLEKFNMQIESLPSILELKEMPSKNDVLFIPTKRYDIGADRVAELLDWVKQGGHLIVLARYSHSEKKSKDELFNELGVTTDQSYDASPFLDLILDESEDKEESQDEAEKMPDDESDKEDRDLNDRWTRAVVNIPVNDQIEDKKVAFLSSRWMDNEGRYEPSWEVKGKNGSHLIEFQIEDGWVTLLSEIDFLTNRNLKKNDHAAFLHTLVHINNSDRKLWIIRNDDNPSLLSILLDKYYPAVLAFIAFVLIWLWYASRRFGPIARDPERVRRSMSEHIVSTGHYQWRNKNRNELLASVQKALHEQIVQTRPLWVRLPDKELAEKLAKLAGLEQEKVYQAITSKSVEKELEFAATIEVFSTIRKKL